MARATGRNEHLAMGCWRTGERDVEADEPAFPLRSCCVVLGDVHGVSGFRVPHL